MGSIEGFWDEVRSSEREKVMMKLSEAIRLGSMMHPQGRIHLISADGLRTCALGAAGIAVGIEVNHYNMDYTNIKNTFPILRSITVHPVNKLRGSVVDTVWKLNDHYGWTREAIADWVETIENQAEAEVKQHEVQHEDERVEVTV